MLEKIQKGIEFFKSKSDYKKSEVYLRRFESLKLMALEKIHMKIIKSMREANSECNLRVVQTGIFDRATKFEELDISQIIYSKSKLEQF